MGACRITPAAGGEVCEHRQPTAHSSPQPAGYLLGRWQVLGQKCLLNQCPLRMELHKFLNQGEREVSAWGLAPARATSHTHTGLHQLGPDQQPFPIPNAGSHHLSAFS